MKKLISVLLIVMCCIAAFSQADGYVKTPGAMLYYRSFGRGEPIVIINGGPGMNSDGFVALAKQLSLHYRAVIFDQRGTGKSTLVKTDSTTVTLHNMAMDLEALRKELGLKKWTVLGHSFGGMLGSYYATLYPEHIERLILSSSGGIDLDLLNYFQESINSKLSPAEKETVALWNEKIEAGDTSHYAKLQRGKGLAAAYVYNRSYIPIIAERLTQSKPAVGSLVWADLARINFDCAEKLKNFDKPVLIIQGKQDIVSEKMAQKAHAVLKRSTVVLMDRCVHYGWLDRPDVYFSEIEKIMQVF